MRDIEKESSAPARGIGRVRGGWRESVKGKGWGERGRTPATDQSVETTQRKIRSSRIRIEEIIEQPQIPRVLIASEHLRVQPIKNPDVVQASEEGNESEEDSA